MADDRWRRTWEIFHDAIDRAPEVRAAFVADACGADAQLLREVSDLIAAHHSDAAFLEHPPVLPAGPEPVDLPAGGLVGPYVVQRVIGQGGMGTVYEARLQGEIVRRVALKLVRSGMESREILARFSVERQALALMTHPNIATAYDVGVTPDGWPYFAMEYVDGVPLTHYCDEHRLTIGERLGLFLQICDAVQHAHQKGIVHRDLKPSNVLVGREGGRTILKVIDFGVAKAIGPRPADRSFFTEAGRFIGTPEYMSPEQAGVTGTDVDTRADIYSLGVMLYELLAGVLPVDATPLQSVSFGEVERLLFGEELPRPSQRVAVLGEARDAIASRRGLTTAALVRQLRGDLDWIVGRAMEKDRDRRYASASELAADVQRFLDHQPVLAGPPTTVYRLRKFIARHRTGVAAAATLAVVSIGFVISLAVSNARTTRALNEAGVERERAGQVSSFLVDLFRVSKPSTAQANAVTARELLDKGAADIRARLDDQPAVRARLMDTMGEVYTNLGLLDQAGALLQDALDLRRNTLGADHKDVADTLTKLGRLYVSKGEYKEALQRYREALAIYRRLPDPDPLDASAGLNNVGMALRALGNYDDAERALQESLAIRTARLGADDPSAANTLLHLGSLASARGETRAAEDYRRRAIELLLRQHGEGHIDVARARNDLATVLFQKGDAAAAEALFRQALATYRAVLGEDHAEIATVKNNLASSLRQQGKLADAEPLYRDAVSMRRRLLGDQHPEVAVALNNLALLLRDQGDAASAVAVLRESLAIMRRSYGEAHANVASTLANLGEVLHETGASESEAMLADALARRRKLLPPTHTNVAVSLSLVGHARAERGDARGGEPLLREALASMRKTWPEDHARVAQAKSYLGGALVMLGRREEAEPLLREGLTVLAKGGSAHDRQYAERQLAAIRPNP